MPSYASSAPFSRARSSASSVNASARASVHCTPLVNDKWVFGYGHQLGQHEVDRENFERSPKPSAGIYAAIVKTQRAGPPMAEPRTRWGIAGTGQISQTTVKDLRLTENVEVLAVSSRFQESADSFAADEGIERAYGDYARMLEDPDIDIVYICTPHSEHFPMAVAAIEAGKHVLAEKPIGVDAAQARELAALAEQHGTFLMEAMWMKFNPMIRTLQKTIAEGAIGDVRWVHAAFGFGVPYDPASRFWDPEQGGGALLDVGIYPIMLAQLFMGVPERISAEGTINPDGVDKRVLVNLTGGDVLAQLSTSIEHMLAPRAVIAGTDGFIDVDMPFWVSGGFTVWPEGLRPGGAVPYEVREPIEGVGYVPMFRAVSRAVLEGHTECESHPLSASIEVLDTIDAVRRQLLQRRGPF